MKIRCLLLSIVAFVAFVSTAFSEPRIKIIDGQTVSESVYPFVARLDYQGDLLCTGTLVGTRHILTAAHCFFGERNTRAVGDTEIVARLNGVNYNSSKVFIHPAYRSRNSACVEGETDAAMIELSTDVTNATPVGLLTTPLPLGENITLVGYGTQGTGDGGEDGTIPPVGFVNVGNTVAEGFGDSPPAQNSASTYFYWTFDRGEANTASGDSGGPAFYIQNNTNFIAGITCGGDGNAGISTLSFNTRADLMASWVQSIAGTTPTNSAPGFTSFGTISITLGKAYSYRVPVTGSAPVSVTASGLPAGLTFDGTNITGTPTEKGTFVVSLSASNAFGSAAADLTLVVAQFDPAIQVRKVLLQFDNAGDGEDFLDVDGKITLPAKFKPAGKTVKVTIGRFSADFTLNKRGRSVGGNNAFFDLIGPQRRGAFAKPKVTFNLTLDGVSLFSELATLGFPATDDAVPGQVVPLPVTINISGIEGSVTTLLTLRASDLRWVIAK